MTVTIEGITFTGDDPYQRVGFRGVTMNKRTVAGCLTAERRIGRAADAYPQGSYHSGSVSAGTHDGGGAVDIFDHERDKIQHVLRAVGFAGWHRHLLPGVWDPHVHAIMLADKEMSAAARAQVSDYQDYLDGLASHAPDNSWHPFVKGTKPRPLFNYPAWVKNNSRPWDGGDVFAHKLDHGTTDSDSVRRLQHELGIFVTGNYGPATVKRVKVFQHNHGSQPSDGKRVSMGQARTIFDHRFTLHP